MTTHESLIRAQALAEAHKQCCAHIAISDAAYEAVLRIVSLPELDAQYMEAKRTYAKANGLDPDNVPYCIHDFWDAATPEERTASWAKARAAARGEG